MLAAFAARRAAALVAPRLSPIAAQAAPAMARAFADEPLKRTPFYDFNVAAGGKMVPFAGYSMPVQFKDSIIDSTTHCRSGASIFDVAHMCGLQLKGKDAIPFLEQLVVGDIASLKDGTGTLSVITNEQGGCIDDTVITKVADDHIYLVVNAGCREKDLAHFEKHLAAFDGDCKMHVYDERSLVALQGPKAVATLASLTPSVDFSKKYFSDFFTADVAGVECFITRTGYTGEDGFELSIPNEAAVTVVEKMLAQSDVRLAGLGARDALRLEAGLCLYGNDLDETKTPVEAGLTWTVGKRRREKFDFLGGEVIKAQIADPASVKQRRVGLVAEGAPPRGGALVTDADGKQVGTVTSGAVSPVLKNNVAMAYVEKALAKAGTELKVVVRGKSSKATVTKMPFVPTSYYKAA